MAFPNINGRVDYQVQVAIERLKAEVARVSGQVVGLHRTVSAIPAPLTFAEVQQGLSASGTAPLNLTGLIGATVAGPAGGGSGGGGTGGSGATVAQAQLRIIVAIPL